MENEKNRNYNLKDGNSGEQQFQSAQGQNNENRDASDFESKDRNAGMGRSVDTDSNMGMGEVGSASQGAIGKETEFNADSSVAAGTNPDRYESVNNRAADSKDDMAEDYENNDDAGVRTPSV